MEKTEHCAVIGVAVQDEAQLLSDLYEGLSALQHRGQESVGISFFDRSIHTRKSMGLTYESKIFHDSIQGSLGIGHERYSTTGRSILANAQPLEMKSKSNVTYAFAFNGNVKNFLYLKSKTGYREVYSDDSDVELLSFLFGRELGSQTPEEIYRHIAPQIDGSYSALMLIEGKQPQLIAFRDPLGIRPLSIGRRDHDHFVASESVAFSDCYLDAQFLRDIQPGEMVTLSEGELSACQIFTCPFHAHCMFEWVYFARMDSVLEGIPVYQVRERLGACLAEAADIEADMVVPVPDSGRSAAAGYARAANIPLYEVFQVDRYTYRRIFIMPDQTQRVQKAGKKLNILPLAVQGKRVVVVDDSIVRGTNMRNMVINKLQHAGASEVHVRISCPPLIDRCPYGVDFHQGELLASQYRDLPHLELCDKIRKELDATTVYYNTLSDLVRSIGLNREELCMGCLTGIYPQIDWTEMESEW